MKSSPYSRLLQCLARDGIEQRILAAMAEVPREEFVPAMERSQAYEDIALPIGHGQTISQPYVVAFMTQNLELSPTDRVLEIGTGSGYQAAILSKLVSEVYTTEIVEELAEEARQRFAKLGITNIRMRVGDGSIGWPEAAPFDAIIATCAAAHVPPQLVEQLAESGRMIVPLGEPFQRQDLCLLWKEDGRVERRSILPVRFVPMVGVAQYEEGE